MRVIFYEGYEVADQIVENRLGFVARAIGRWRTRRSTRKQIAQAKAAGLDVCKFKRGKWYRWSNLRNKYEKIKEN